MMINNDSTRRWLREVEIALTPAYWPDFELVVIIMWL